MNIETIRADMIKAMKEKDKTLKDVTSSLIAAIKNAHAGDTILPAKIARRITVAAKDIATDREIRHPVCGYFVYLY